MTGIIAVVIIGLVLFDVVAIYAVLSMSSYWDDMDGENALDLDMDLTEAQTKWRQLY